MIKFGIVRYQMGSLVIKFGIVRYKMGSFVNKFGIVRYQMGLLVIKFGICTVPGWYCAHVKPTQFRLACSRVDLVYTQPYSIYLMQAYLKKDFLTLLAPGGGGVFHLQPSKWLRTPKQNKLSP